MYYIKELFVKLVTYQKLYRDARSAKYKIILHVVLYGCENWSLTLSEERRLRVFDNRKLRKISGPKSTEITWEWRRLHNEELKDLYSPHIIRVVKSRIMRWVEHVACMWENKTYTGFWWGNLRERNDLADPDVDGRIILKWIFGKWNLGSWNVLIWLRRGTGGGLLRRRK